MCSARVSMEEQAREGFSLESIKRLCDYKKYKIYKVYREEGVSTKNMKHHRF